MNASAVIVIGIVIVISMVIAALGAEMPRPLGALPADPVDAHALPADAEPAA